MHGEGGSARERAETVESRSAVPTYTTTLTSLPGTTTTFFTACPLTNFCTAGSAITFASISAARSLPSARGCRRASCRLPAPRARSRPRSAPPRSCFGPAPQRGCLHHSRARARDDGATCGVIGESMRSRMLMPSVTRAPRMFDDASCACSRRAAAELVELVQDLHRGRCDGVELVLRDVAVGLLEVPVDRAPLRAFVAAGVRPVDCACATARRSAARPALRKRTSTTGAGNARSLRQPRRTIRVCVPAAL